MTDEATYKDPGTAGLLGFFFGSFGLFYLGWKYVVISALIMIAAFAVVVVISNAATSGLIDEDYFGHVFILGIFAVFLVNSFYARQAAKQYNLKLAGDN